MDEIGWALYRQKMKGGPRESAYSKPKKKKKKMGRIEKFRRESADFKRKVIDEYSK